MKSNPLYVSVNKEKWVFQLHALSAMAESAPFDIFQAARCTDCIHNSFIHQKQQRFKL